MLGWLKRMFGSPALPRFPTEPATPAFVPWPPKSPESPRRSVERPAHIPRRPQHSDCPVYIEAAIAYVDVGGRVTARRISTLGISRHATCGWSVESYCHLREDIRTFVSSGITEFVDLTTGEVVDDIDSRFAALYRDCPKGILEMAIEEHGAEITVLVYLARRSGKLMKDKREAIADYVRGRFHDGRVSVDLLREKVRLWDCDERTFRAGLKKLAKKLDQERREEFLRLLPTFAPRNDDPFTSAALGLAEKTLRPASKPRKRAGDTT